MSTETTCLDNIIGLSETTCECFESDKPANYDTSTSGIYLDQLEGLNLKLIDAAADCEEGSLWDMAAKARATAIASFKADLMARLMQKHRPKRDSFSGKIGNEKYKNNVSQIYGVMGTSYRCAEIKGGTMVVRRIGLAFGHSATFNISVYNNYQNDPIAIYEVNSTANTVGYYTLPTPLELPMSTPQSDYTEYFFLYEPSGFYPKDTDFGCGPCTGYTPVFDRLSPRFMPPRRFTKNQWAQYVMAAGVYGSDASTWEKRDNLSCSSTRSYGLILDVEFKCDYNGVICSEDIDFDSNPLARVMAYAIQYRAGASLADRILASPEINTLTMTGREPLMGKRNHWIKEYNQRMDYLAEEIDVKVNDCLTCRDTDHIIKAGIFS